MNRSIRLLLFPTLFIVFQNVAAQQGATWTLEKCLDYAVSHNIQLQQSSIQQKVGQNNLLQSKLTMLPNISGNATYSLDNGSSLNFATYTYTQGNSQNAYFQLQASVPIFMGLQQLNGIGKSKADLFGNKFDLADGVNTVALNITSAFLNIVLNKEILKVAEEQKRLDELQSQNTNSRIKAGALAESAIYEKDAQIARDEVAIVNAKNSVDLSLLQLKNQMSIRENNFDVEIPEVAVDRIDPIDDQTANSIYSYALRNQPSIKSAEAKLRSADYSHKIALGSLSPTISLTTNLTSGFTVPDKIETVNQQLKRIFRKSVGISVNVPIFSNWTRMTNIQNSKLQMQSRQLDVESKKLTLWQNISQAYADAKAAVESYFSNQKSYESAKQAFDVADKRYAVGMMSNLEFQQAKTNMLNAEAEVLKAKYTYIFKTKILDFYQGKPITLK